ncbi:MAG: epoxyqueuosine reductase QueH [Chloroflexi bacterium]|nr:epoxyqueuosine reductase QueH [Chloroflexota bacterium]
MKVVLHVCCGVCAAGAAAALIEEGHEVLGYFYNPNIHPLEEYGRRLAAAQQVADRLKFRLETGPYMPEIWLKETEELRAEPEGGRRCSVCYQIRLESTYHFMEKCGADAFTTTLTVSPHKSAEIVNKVGAEIGGDKFLARNFKKKEGFKRAVESARRWGLYRQDYCGCIYSMNQRSALYDCPKM